MACILSAVAGFAAGIVTMLGVLGFLL